MSKKDAFHLHLQQEPQGQRRKGHKGQGCWRGRPFRRLSKKLGGWRGGVLDWKEKRVYGKGGVLFGSRVRLNAASPIK